MLPPMRHLAFFEAIAEHPEQGDPVWVESVAGMLVLRFFEEWLDSPALASVNEPGIGRMRAMIDEIENPEIRHLLGTAVSVLMHADGADPVLVVGPLLAYAHALEDVSRDTLAADVLETVAETLERHRGPHALRLAAATYRKLGTLLARMKHFDDAEERCRRASSCAGAVNDLPLVLEARIAQAKIWLARGNLGDVESAMAAVIDQAQAAGLSRLNALGRRVRGSALEAQGRYGQALQELYLAYPNASDEFEREFLLGDMAGCAGQLGLRSTARILYQTLSKTAMNYTARSIARVNLLEIAVLDGDQVGFQTLWKELEQVQLPITIDMHARLYRAQGIERWTTTQAAVESYQLLADDAAKAGVRQVEFIALEAVDRLQSMMMQEKVSDRVSSNIHDATTSEWQDITQAIEELCNLKLHAAGLAP